ncbi:MAG: hypothetical protein M0Z58_09685 [Nitrospiraceae bacterium]|nr:hypothetical protein [Nitrospiraceae bacterium]
MKEDIILNEKIGLLQKELGILADKLSGLEKSVKGLEDMEREMKALKLFLGRHYPEFKKEYPAIIEKIHS